MFGFNRNARNAQIIAQREAEEAAAEAERKAYLAGLQEGRRQVYNEKNQPVVWSVESAEFVIRNHVAKQQRPDVPMRRVNGR
jgi:hypothetical protein